jgi:hypothetical protein
MRTSMMIVPKIATFALMPKEKTIAMTATTPPIPSAYFIAGTALTARSKKVEITGLGVGPDIQSLRE